MLCRLRWCKLLRKHLREKRNKRTEQNLAEFSCFNHLHDVHREPDRRKTPVANVLERQKFAAHFGDTFGCETPVLNMLDPFACMRGFQDFPRFEMHETQTDLQTLQLTLTD